MTTVLNLLGSRSVGRGRPVRLAPVVLVLLLLVLLAGCGVGAADDPSGEASSDGRQGDLSIVVTTTILGDVVAGLAGDRAAVEVLLPIGADAHGFAPSAAQVERLREADLVVANGLDLEEGLVDAIAAAEEEGVAVFRATDHVEVLAPASAEGEGGGDPHFWTDPGRMADVALALGEALADLDDPGEMDAWLAAGGSAAADLEALDEEVRDILSVVDPAARRLVSNHESLAYFADAYDFEVVATVIPGSTTLAEPSARDLEGVVAAVRESGTTAIFAETTAPAALAEAVAEEVGAQVQVVTLYTESLSEADGPAATYADLVRFDAQAIADALS